jgi:hypothetical protein
MGVTLTYQAIPPKSDFYARLQDNRAFRLLSSDLFPYGLFRLFQDDPIDFNKIMGRAIKRHPDVFCGSDIEISMLIGEFRESLQITCRDYPKITYTEGSLEKSFEEVSDALTEELSIRKLEDIDYIVNTLLYGDIAFGKRTSLGIRTSPGEESFAIALTSREAVKKGASILRQIEPEMLFPGGDDGEDGWYSREFRGWKKFYLSADDLGAEIIMDVI